MMLSTQLLHILKQNAALPFTSFLKVFDLEIDASAKSWGKIVVTKIGNSFTP